MNIPKDYLWEDCMHIGKSRLPYIHYYLTKDTLYVNKGILNTSSSQISLSKVSTVRLTRNVIQKLLGLGTLEVYTIGDSQLLLKLENIEKSEKVQELIMELLN